MGNWVEKRGETEVMAAQECRLGECVKEWHPEDIGSQVPGERERGGVVFGL